MNGELINTSIYLDQNILSDLRVRKLEESNDELEKYPKKAWWLKFYNRFNGLNNGLKLLNDMGDNIAKLFEKIGS
jgi:hypothetical protein